MRLTIISFFLFFATHIHSQHLIEEGYIVTLAGDSILGEIKLMDQVSMNSEVLFSENNNAFASYTPSELSSFGYSNNRIRYERLQIPVLSKDGVIESDATEFRFAKVLEAGEMTLWTMKTTLKDRYFIRKEGEIFSFDPSLSHAFNYEVLFDRITFYNSKGEEIATVILDGLQDEVFSIHNSDQKYRLLNDTLYRVRENESNFLRALLSDCPDVIHSEGKSFGQSLLSYRVNEYNECIAPKSVKRYKGKAMWQFSMLGWFGYNNHTEARIGVKEQFGATLELRRNDWTPNVSISFHTGFSKAPLINEEGFTDVLPWYESRFRYKEQTDFRIYRVGLQYHFYQGKRLRPYGTVGYGKTVRATSLWTEPDLSGPDVFHRGTSRFGFFGVGLDYYLLDHIQFRFFVERMIKFSYGFGLGLSF